MSLNATVYLFQATAIEKQSSNRNIYHYDLYCLITPICDCFCTLGLYNVSANVYMKCSGHSIYHRAYNFQISFNLGFSLGNMDCTGATGSMCTSIMAYSNNTTQ